MKPKKNFRPINDDSVFSSVGIRIGKNIPTSYKFGRNAAIQLGKVERDLFSGLEEGRRAYIISGIDRRISKMEFTAFSFAMAQTLYNESYIDGNSNTNTGRGEPQIAVTASKEEGKTLYFGNIITSLNEICRLAFGTKNPDTQQRKSMQKVIDILDSVPVEIKANNGSYYKAWYCKKMGEGYSKENGELYYNLHLNPIFCSDVSRNFGELPQDIMMRLSNAVSKKTDTHYMLLRLLSIQAKHKPFVRSLGELLNELDLSEAYKANKSRTIKQLLAVCDSMKSIGMITNYGVDYQTIRAKRTITKITFHFTTREQLIGHKEAK